MNSTRKMRTQSEKNQCDVTPQVNLEEFLEGRANEEAYSVFFDIFAPILEKKSVRMENLATNKPEKQMLTISSEAFGLLLLENSWDRWVDQYNLSGVLVPCLYSWRPANQKGDHIG